MLSPSPSLPVACSEHGWHLPFYFPRGSHGRAALARPGRQREAEQRASTQHPIALRQLLLSNANRATTRPWEADSIMARRKGSGREPSLPTRSRCWQVPVPCSAMGKHHEIELPGRAEQSREDVVETCLPRSAITAGLVGAGGQLCRSPRSLLSLSPRVVQESAQ